jgi:hypothetical protein
MPDQQADRHRPYPDDLPANVDRALFGAVARFRDAAGVHWRIHTDGHPTEEPETP